MCIRDSFTTVPPDLIISPLPFTPLNPKTKSLTLPALNLLDPAKLQATQPPTVPLFDFPFLM